MSSQRVAVVDGANVAYLETSAKGKPRVANLVAVRRALERRGYDPIIIVDASLRHHIDDEARLENLIGDQVARQAPAGTDADYFVLETADRFEGMVISNDAFERFRERYPWIEARRIPLMIIRGKVEFYEQKLDGDET